MKTRFSAACDSAGQLVPAQAAPEDLQSAVIAARSLGYPLIMKPKSHLVVGTAERGQLVHHEAELRRVYRQYAVVPGQGQLAARHAELRWPLLQRYLRSAQHCVFSVSGIKDIDRGLLAATLSRKQEQWPPDIGVSTVQTVCHDERILAAGLATVDKLLSCGIFELELLAEGEKLLAIDLNPRAFGFMMLDMAVGNDLPWLWWQTTLDVGEPPRKPLMQALECRFVVPYYFKRGIHRLLTGRALPSPPGATGADSPWISMLGNRKDLVPMLVANLRLLRLLPHRGGLLRPYIAAAWRSRRK